MPVFASLLTVTVAVIVVLLTTFTFEIVGAAPPPDPLTNASVAPLRKAVPVTWTLYVVLGRKAFGVTDDTVKAFSATGSDVPVTASPTEGVTVAVSV